MLSLTITLCLFQVHKIISVNIISFWKIETAAVLELCVQQMKAVAETGCKVVVTGGKVGEMYLHYANKYRLMVVRLLTKFDLRRLCKSIGATALPRLVSAVVSVLLSSDDNMNLIRFLALHYSSTQLNLLS